MKKLRLVVGLLLVLLMILSSSIVLADSYSYYLEFTVTDTGGADRTYVPILTGIKGTNLYNAGYIESTGLDTDLQEGSTSQTYMMDTAELSLVIPSLTAYQTNTFRLYMNYDPAQTAFPIIVGDSGYITIADAAALELGDDFEIEMDGYINFPSDGSIYTNTFFYKPAVFRIYATTSGRIYAVLYEEDWVSPIGCTDPDTAWTNEPNVYDENTGTYAYTSVDATSWSSFIEITPDTAGDYSSIYNKVRYYSGYNAAQGANQITQIDIDYQDEDEAWQDLYSGVVTHGSWQTVNFTDPTYASFFRVRFYNNAGGARDARLYEFDCGDAEVSAVAVNTPVLTSDDMAVKVTADGSDMKIYIDDVLKDTEALGGASAVDNSYDWLLMNNLMSENNILAYCDYYKHTVSDTLIVHYEPAAMLTTTAVPDLEGAAQNGTITWGSNSDITVTVKGVTSYESTTSDFGGTSGVADTMHDADQPTGWYGTGTGSGLPFYSTFSDKATELGMPSQSLYVMMMLGVATAVGLGVLVTTGSTMLAALACGIGIAAGVNTGVLSTWMIFVYAILAIGILYLARQQ